MKKLIWVMLIMLILCASVALATFTLSVASPSDNSWSTNADFFQVEFNATGTDDNYICSLHSDHAGNTFGEWDGITNYANGTLNITNATNIQMNVTNAALGINTSTAFEWSIHCNESIYNASNVVHSENFTSTGIDFTPPTDFACNGLLDHSSFANNSYWTDYTPTPQWNASVETNFSRYTLWINSSVRNGESWDYDYNISSISSLNQEVTLTNTSVDQTIYWGMSAYDLAGNERNSSNCLFSNAELILNVDNTCSQLTAGWNLCGIVRDGPVKADTICREIPNCDFVSKYNKTHEFQTYTNGSSVNNGMNFTAGGDYNSSVFIFVSANTTWENRTWEVDDNDASSFTFTNGTDGTIERRWNVVPVINRACTANFTAIDISISGDGENYTNNLGTRGNISFISYYNNSEGTGGNKPFISNWSINGGIIPTFGEAYWAYFNNDTGLGTWTWNASSNNNAIC